MVSLPPPAPGWAIEGKITLGSQSLCISCWQGSEGVFPNWALICGLDVRWRVILFKSLSINTCWHLLFARCLLRAGERELDPVWSILRKMTSGGDAARNNHFYLYHVCVCVCVCMREREREAEKVRDPIKQVKRGWACIEWFILLKGSGSQL